MLLDFVALFEETGVAEDCDGQRLAADAVDVRLDLQDLTLDIVDARVTVAFDDAGRVADLDDRVLEHAVAEADLDWP